MSSSEVARSVDGPPLTIIVPLPPTYRGGTEEYAYRLAGRFAQRLPVRILTTTVRAGSGTPAVEIGEIPVTRLRAREIFERPLLVGPAARAALKEAVRTSTAVQLHMPFPFVERAVGRWSERFGVPLVLTYHMDALFPPRDDHGRPTVVTRAYRSISALPAVARARAVVSNSAGYARVSPVLSRYLGKTRVVAKGIAPERLGASPDSWENPARAEPGERLLPGSTPDERRVLFVGRLVPYKGIPVLVEAVKRLQDRVPRLKLYIAGRGPEEANVREAIRSANLGNRATLLGFVPDAAVGELYRSADVVACPSLNLLESTATALEEAAACGTPTLGSSLPGADETIPNDGIHGLLVQPNDPHALANALERLLGQPRPTRRAAFRTWDDTAEEYLALFHELGAGPAISRAPPRYA